MPQIAKYFARLLRMKNIPQNTVSRLRIHVRMDELYEMDLNVPKIVHSVRERVDCVILLVLVVLLSKHICDLILNKKHCKSLRVGETTSIY